MALVDFFSYRYSLSTVTAVAEDLMLVVSTQNWHQQSTFVTAFLFVNCVLEKNY